MKKYLWVSLIVVSAVFFGTLGMLHAEAVGALQAGVAAAVKGEVKATTPPAKAAHALKSGDKVFMGDKIETGADGQLQVLLLDETVFTLGPLSSIMVDEFVYDPENAKKDASVVKGALRAVTGKVAQRKQENAAETEVLLNTMDEMDQRSEEAAQDRAQSSVESTHR